MLDKKYNDLINYKEKLETDYKNLFRDFEYQTNVNSVLLNEIEEAQKIIDDINAKLNATLGDIDRTNYLNILLKTYNLKALLYDYDKYFKKKTVSEDVNDYHKNLIKPYYLFNILNNYKLHVKNKNSDSYNKNLIKSYYLFNLLNNYKSYVNKIDVNDYNKNLLKKYVLFNILNKYKLFKH